MGDSLARPENKGRKHSNFARDKQATSSSVDVTADLNRVVERVEIKSILRKKLQDKTKSSVAFLLEKWKSELSAAGFNCEILHLTKKHSPVEDAEDPLAVFPERVLVVYPSELHTFTHQTGPFQPACPSHGVWRRKVESPKSDLRAFDHKFWKSRGKCKTCRIGHRPAF